MASSYPQAPRRVLPVQDLPDGAAEPDDGAAEVLTREFPSPDLLTAGPGDRFASSPVAFVVFAVVVFAFVFGLLVLTRLHPAQVLQIAGSTGAICVGAFFGRNALVVIGRRLIADGKQ